MPDSIQNEADIYVHNVALTKCQQQNVDTTHPCYHSMSKLQILATTTRRYYNPCYHKTSRLQILATTIRRNYKSLLPQHVDTTNPCYHETSILKFLLPQNVDTTNLCFHKTSIPQNVNAIQQNPAATNRCTTQRSILTKRRHYST